MQKTVKKWFEMLPPEIRDKAIKNTSRRTLNAYTTNLHDALSIAFLWAYSREDYDYWKSISQLIDKGEFDKEREVTNGN